MKSKKPRNKIAIALAALFIAVTSSCALACSDPESKDGRYEQSTEYVNTYIDTNEIFHDQADVFMQPTEPTSSDNVTVRLRTRRGNVNKAAVQFTVDVDKINTGAATWHDIDMKFEQADKTGRYDYWIAVIPAQSTPYKYHFKVSNNKFTAYANYYEKMYEEQDTDPFTGKSEAVNPIDTASDWYVMPDYATPDWSKGALWYSLMPDSFYNGNVLNDKNSTTVYTQTPWGATHSDGVSYFGGDLDGIERMIDYFRELNVDAININPINWSHHNAGYGSMDLLQVDACFGNDAVLKRLTDNLHENDMRIMMDGVFTYFVSHSVYYNLGSVLPTEGGEKPGSKWYDVFKRDNNGNLVDSVWGSPRLDFSNKITRDVVYSSPDSIMQYYLREIGIDGWRLDVGPDLIGSVSGQWSTPGQIIRDMRRYLKDVKEDFLLCSEGGSGDMLTDYALDTKWNTEYYQDGMSFLKYESSASRMDRFSRSLYENVLSLPRPMANSSYNYVSCHDNKNFGECRPLAYADQSLSKVMATNVVNMTFTGAPCLYFGDEVGMGGTDFFDGMNWNRSEWNYDLFHTVKALSRLRADFKDVYKDGVIKDLGTYDCGDNRALFAFARWKGNDKTFTVANPYAEAIEIELDVHSAEVADGEILYDYLSGNAYEVRDGKVKIKVQSGGAVLVNRKAGISAGKYLRTEIGGIQTATAQRNDACDFTVSGSGKIGGVSDSAAFYALPVFNNCELTADISASSGSYALMLRAKNDAAAPFYALALDGSGNGKITYRTSEGQRAKTVDVGSLADKTVKLVRASDNKFALYAKSGTGDFIKTDASQVYIDAEYRMYAGFAPLEGVSSIKNLSVSAAKAQLYTDFSSASDSMTYVEGSGSARRLGGKLIISQSTDNPTAVLAQAPMRDFSVKAQLLGEPAEGGYQGVTVYGDADSFVFAGKRTYNSKTEFVFAQCINGAVTVRFSAPAVLGNAVFQIEKTGQYYTARYDAGNGFVLLGDKVAANWSDIKAGCINFGASAAEFGWLSFGNAIVDGESYAAHAKYGYIDYSYDRAREVYTQVTYYTEGGKWEYETGYMRQTLRTAQSSFGPSQADFKGFIATYTLRYDAVGNNAANVALVFGSGGKAEYKLELGHDGTLKLTGNDIDTASYTIDGFSLGTPYSFTVCVTDENDIVVYCGDKPMPVITASVPSYSGGKVYIRGYKSAYAVSNYMFNHYYNDWWNYTTQNGSNMSTQYDYMIVNANPQTSGALVRDGVTDFILGANVRLNKKYIYNSVLGLVIDGSAGRGNESGIYVQVDSAKNLTVGCEGKTLAETALNVDYESFYMIVVVQNRVLSVYVDKYAAGYESGIPQNKLSTTPALTYDLGKATGGSLNVYGAYGYNVLANLKLYGLKNGEDYTALDVFTERKIESPVQAVAGGGNAFTAAGSNKIECGFASQDDLSKIVRYNGVWFIEGGKLTGLGKNNWFAGVTLAYGKFDNFELHYKVDCKVSDGWAGVLIDKTVPDASHEDGGKLFYTNADGMNVFYADGNRLCGSGALDNDGFLSVVIRVYGTTVEVKVGNAEATVFKNVARPAGGGYISLVAGNCEASFKDIEVYKLNGSGNRV